MSSTMAAATRIIKQKPPISGDDGFPASLDLFNCQAQGAMRSRSREERGSMRLARYLPFVLPSTLGRAAIFNVSMSR